MADDTNDTRRDIGEEDREIRQRPEARTDTDRSKYQKGASGMSGGENEAEGVFAHEGEAATGGAMGGGPDGTGNTGAELPGNARSEFARTTGGQTGGMHTTPGGGSEGSPSGLTGEMTSGTSGSAGSASGGAGGQSVGTVGTIGGSANDTDVPRETSTGTHGSRSQGGTSEYGAQGSGGGQQEPLGADHEHSALGGSVTAAGGGSTGPGPGQTGTDRDRGFIGSKGTEPAERAQQRGSAEEDDNK